jgi:hypothetical protein
LERYRLSSAKISREIAWKKDSIKGRRTVNEGRRFMTFDSSAVYIVGNAKTQQNNPISLHYGQFFVGFVVEREGGKILACGMSAMISITNEFVSSLFVGRTLLEDAEAVRQLLETHYFGSSQKAILVAYKDAQKKYIRIISGQAVDLNE